MFTGHYVQLHFAPAAAVRGNFGVNVGKRVCPKAVDRNYVKRVLRAWYLPLANELANDLIVRVKRRYDGRQFADLSRELDNLLNKASRWRASLS